MEKGHFGEYSGNARHSRTPVTKHNVHAAERDDAAHIDYLKRDILWDDKHGHSDIDMTADEKHISKLAGDLKYDKKHHSPLHQKGDYSDSHYSDDKGNVVFNPSEKEIKSKGLKKSSQRIKDHKS